MSAKTLTALAAVALLTLPQMAAAQKFISVDAEESLPIVENFPVASESVDPDPTEPVLAEPVLASAQLLPDADPEAFTADEFDRPDPDIWAATPGPEGNLGECNDGTLFDVETSRCYSN